MTQAEPTTTQVMVNAKSSDSPSSGTIQPGSVRVSMKDNSPLTTDRTSSPMNGSNGHLSKYSTAPLQVVFKDVYLSLRSNVNGDVGKEKNDTPKSADKSNPPPPSKNEKIILNKCTGVFEPGRICAVLGASGAGKTSLIQLISGHRTWPSSSVVKSEGKIFINGEEAGEGRLRQLCAFVYQDDVMYESLTVREIITLAAMLRLPQSLSDDEKKDRIESVIDMLALRKCAETRVGSGGTSGGVGGISGGEKRRLSMAIEMINNPSILFLDEPTSGLDTYTAFSIVRILKSIAVKYNRTIVFTIHQPSSDIYHLFDDIMLLANGRMVYQGDAHRVVDYVAHHGYYCPEYVNIADYLFMNVLYDHKHLKSEVFSNKKSGPSSDAETAEKESARKKLTESERERMNGLLDAWIISTEYQSILSRIDSSPYKNGIPKTIQTSQAQASFKTQFKLLTERVIKNLLRNRLSLRASAGQMTFFAVFTGLIYLQISMNQGGVQDRMGSLFFFAVQGVMAAMSMNLATFSVERDIFLREFNSGMYSLPAFFFSRVLAEIPFRILFVFIYTAIAYWMIGYQATFENFITFYFIVLGVDTCGQNIGKAIATGFPNINVALAIGPAMMMPMMLFAGLYINLKKIPQYFRWLSYLSPMRWGYVGLSRLEYPGLKFDKGPNEIRRYNTGEDVLKYLGFDDQPDPWYCVLILFSFALFFSGLAYFLLYRGTRKLA